MNEITKTEFEVLDALWEAHPASANDIVDRLNKRKEWHEKTVKTLLGRLVKKNVIGFDKQKRSYLYFPLLERDAYVVKESESLVQRLFGGRISHLVAGFADAENLTKQDVEELKSLIANWEKDND